MLFEDAIDLVKGWDDSAATATEKRIAFYFMTLAFLLHDSRVSEKWSDNDRGKTRADWFKDRSNLYNETATIHFNLNAEHAALYNILLDPSNPLRPGIRKELAAAANNAIRDISSNLEAQHKTLIAVQKELKL